MIELKLNIEITILVVKPLKDKYKGCFTIDSNYDEKSVVICVNSDISPINILSNQGIWYGKDGEIRHRTSFIRANNSNK